MKLLVVLSAVLAITAALPQRRPQKAEEPQPLEDQQTAEQNYNNYPQQQKQQQQKQIQQNYRQDQQEQNYKQQQQEQNYRQQEQQTYRQQEQQEYRQSKPIDDFRPKVQLETTTYIPIIRFDKQQGTDGSYKTGYETGNHITAEEQGYLKNVGENHDALVQQGSYSYTAPDGQVITVEYTADEFGFRVKGDHIPTPPPVSPEIQKGLDLIYAGIKANAARAEEDARSNPEAHKQNQDKAALDYKGLYYQQ